MAMALGLGRGLRLDGCHNQPQELPNFGRMKAEGPYRLLMVQEVLSCTPVPPLLLRETLEVEVGP